MPLYLLWNDENIVVLPVIYLGGRLEKLPFLGTDFKMQSWQEGMTRVEKLDMTGSQE